MTDSWFVYKYLHTFMYTNILKSCSKCILLIQYKMFNSSDWLTSLLRTYNINISSSCMITQYYVFIHCLYISIISAINYNVLISLQYNLSKSYQLFIYKKHWNFIYLVHTKLSTINYNQVQWHRYQKHSTNNNKVCFHRHCQTE